MKKESISLAFEKAVRRFALLGRPKAPEFVTFWHGPLDAITYTCLASFPHYGSRLRLYSFAADVDVPKGVELFDARQICPDESLVYRYIAEGRPSFAKFANLFRYRAIHQTGCCWVDADILCLKKPDFNAKQIVFGRQVDAPSPWSINSAVLKLPPEHPMLTDLIRRAEDVVDIDQDWGVIGPLLLTELAAKYGIDHHARDKSNFYPIFSGHAWKPLLAEYCDAVRLAVKEATFIHLWHEYFRRFNYDKSACPPDGSFLYAMCRDLGTLNRFDRIYSDGELRASKLVAVLAPEIAEVVNLSGSSP